MTTKNIIAYHVVVSFGDVEDCKKVQKDHNKEVGKYIEQGYQPYGELDNR